MHNREKKERWNASCFNDTNMLIQWIIEKISHIMSILIMYKFIFQR